VTLLLPVDVTPRARARLAEIAEAEGAPRMLRVAVLGGGCSGFQYELALVEAADAADTVVGGCVAIDPESMPYLQGSVVDFKDELIGARFAIENPNATSSCGCGTSFSL
jgi:iron-sulfur cluster assembly accessory protein